MRGLYVWTAIRHFYGVTNRRQPALTLERDGQARLAGLFFAIVSNASPWTYLGSRPVNPSPEAGFDTGLDVFAVRTLGTLRTLDTLRQMLGRAAAGGRSGQARPQPARRGASSRSARPARWRSRWTGSTWASGNTSCSVPFPNALRVIV